MPAEELQRWLRDLGIAQPYLLFVGNPAKPHKNLDTVVQAYARARRMAQFDAPLICVGSRQGSEFKSDAECGAVKGFFNASQCKGISIGP